MLRLAIARGNERKQKPLPLSSLFDGFGYKNWKLILIEIQKTEQKGSGF
jgi:hypothetical protein